MTPLIDVPSGDCRKKKGEPESSHPHEDITSRGNWNLLGTKFTETVKQWDTMWSHTTAGCLPGCSISFPFQNLIWWHQMSNQNISLTFHSDICGLSARMEKVLQQLQLPRGSGVIIGASKYLWQPMNRESLIIRPRDFGFRIVIVATKKVFTFPTHTLLFSEKIFVFGFWEDCFLWSVYIKKSCLPNPLLFSCILYFYLLITIDLFCDSSLPKNNLSRSN